ncbi:hypothetical protein DL766_008037 [Monosporascus sp. MC13-8B]|uniref:Nitrogen regulatory protein areA GATA-like domain-containing protein n=1 Tax=Monosporascus cannonballus TaxID=155416 RepID=A0ABY0GZQ7_9PEZI|nr:hypothetical protein DL762_008602 [Monosporascus cannonballus]RYP21023.1 hypothetical protein DL766_008037 [Monosporascus sp. MC13-8B]
MAELILPKGIVINTTWIYDEVAKQPVVPPEAIKKYWKVYTTTFHRLVDPTANRLENFWWHVWGSDRRHLPGPVLARLFEEISNGPTFVKLRGPPNRYEPPSQPSSPTRSPVQPSSSQTIPKISKAEQGDPELRVEKKTVAPSSSKKTPGKPILKKPRGPSASGPRPKTRFASPPLPPGSDAEDGGSRDSEAASSASTAVASGGESKVSGGPSAKEPRKKTTTAGVPKKKGPTFVASAASRRRPAMPRRQSSQSATGGSEVTSRETGKSVKKEVSPERTPEAEPKLSTKAAGKRPARQVAPAAPSATAAPTVTESSSSSSGHDTITTGKAQDAPTMIQTKRTPGQQPKPTEDKMADESTKVEVDQVKATKPKPHARDDVQERARPETASRAAHSPQVTGAPRRGSGGVTRGHRVLNTLTSSSTAQTSKATAQGTIIEFDENLPTKQLREQAMNFQHEHGTPGSSSSKPLDPRFIPTPPSAVAAVPLGRSKSQLTLLLGRQAEKKDKKPRR